MDYTRVTIGRGTGEFPVLSLINSEYGAETGSLETACTASPV